MASELAKINDDESLTDGDAKAMGYPNLKSLIDAVSARVGVDYDTTVQAMREHPAVWRSSSELRRH